MTDSDQCNNTTKQAEDATESKYTEQREGSRHHVQPSQQTRMNDNNRVKGKMQQVGQASCMNKNGKGTQQTTDTILKTPLQTRLSHGKQLAADGGTLPDSPRGEVRRVVLRRNVKRPEQRVSCEKKCIDCPEGTTKSPSPGTPFGNGRQSCFCVDQEEQTSPKPTLRPQSPS